MDPKSTPSPTIALNRQIMLLSQLADRVFLRLQEEPISFSGDALEDLAMLAGSLTKISHQIARQEEERENLQALAGISQIINSSLQLDDVLRIVMDTIVRLIGAERGFLMLKDGQGKLAIHIARNWEQETINASESALSRSVVNRVINEGQPILTTNAQQDPRFDSQESVIALNLRSILCVPLKVKDDLIGVIYTDNRIRTGLFTEMERNLLSAFANQAAVAIENARLFESIRHTLAEVSELKNMMDDIFASIASGVITTDLAYRITLINGAAEAILGQDRSELIGRTVGEIPLLRDIHLPYYLARVHQNNRQIIGLEFKPEVSGRGSLALSFNLSPLIDSEGTPQGVAIVMEDLTETRRLEAQRRLFERMVSPAVIEQLDSTELQLGGKRTQITTLFADLRGFTSLSERYAPEELVSVLNRYLGAAAEAILGEGGTIDKFLGDAIMAFFNAPIPQKDHTSRAIRAALSMQAAVSGVQKELPTQFQLSFGIGIHYGEAVLGLIGTQKRMEYTVIGDSVNTAKRLQENANPGQILISAQVFEQVHNQVLAKQVTPVVAKGKSEPIRVYELLGLR